MSKYLRNLVFIVLFLAPSSSFGMNPQVKIQTNDDVEFEIALPVAQQSETLKKMIEDIGEEAEQSIPLPETSQKQFELLLPAMQELAQLRIARPQADEKELAEQLQHIVADLKSNGRQLDNQQLIELVAGINYLDLPILEPALKALAHRMLNKDDWLKLESLGDKLKDLWHVHPAKELAKELIQMQKGWPFQQPDVGGVAESLNGNLISWSSREGIIKVWDKNNLEPITLKHQGVEGVIESLDRNNLISWSWEKGTIKIWDKTNLAEPITLQHPWVLGVIESRDGNNLISWSRGEGTIKVWEKNNLQAEPVTLQHQGVEGVIESLDGKNLISWSKEEGTIKIWDKNNLQAEPVTLQHRGVEGVIENRDGNLISWSKEEGTIKIWDKNNLQAEPVTLQHRGVEGVIESRDGNLISWSGIKDTVKIWDKNNLQAEPVTLQHRGVEGVIENRDGNLISWSAAEGTIKVWDKALLYPTPEQIHLLLAVYFEREGNQKFELPDEKLSKLKAAYPEWLVALQDNKSYMHDAVRFVYGHKWQLVGAGIATALILKTAIRFLQK